MWREDELLGAAGNDCYMLCKEESVLVRVIISSIVESYTLYMVPVGRVTAELIISLS